MQINQSPKATVVVKWRQKKQVHSDITLSAPRPESDYLPPTLIHLINISVTNTSVNPSRSTGVALFAGGWAINQLWLFWVAPIVGSILGAIVYRFIGSKS